MERQMRGGRRAPGRRWAGRLSGIGGGLVAVAILTGSAAAADLPPNWHIHDGQVSLGPEHKGIGFFPTILGQSPSDYLADPARCPNATDKAFLPSADSAESPILRAGVCMTSSVVIHLRTVPVGTSGPQGWSSLTAPSEPGWVTYYLVTPR
jgi:hypothetical protein